MKQEKKLLGGDFEARSVVGENEESLQWIINLFTTRYIKDGDMHEATCKL